ncbi:hypothetical protein [Roseimicrobium sp. ORNL1]|uniref:hypothetical protein n=1 Tax=Roseimicrobium sp. ORNL1 TaxID=2711231 RepID=UPI0013E14941|nr:hypothetical protein [Roseimicrobium sp. ORNL1]QIF01973.1 hypothetical protein G5S37_10670 [Roseimicrobium sp. ORNL1]
MPRRIKLILLGVVLFLLAIPIWHVGSNWAPAEPLRFRLINREKHAESTWQATGHRIEKVEIEVRNTSTAPRAMQSAYLRWFSRKNHVILPYHSLLDPFAQVPVIPPGGTWCGTCELFLPLSESESENNDPGYVQVDYTHASTFRRRVFTWYYSLCVRYFPQSPRLRASVSEYTSSTATLENFP